MMEIVRYSIEMMKVTEESECLYLIGKYVDKLRGETDVSTIIEFAKNILTDKVVPHIG
jgi:hypothetical protein